MADVFSPIKAFGKRNSAEFNDVENSVPGMQMQRVLALQVQKRPRLHELNMGAEEVTEEREMSRSKRNRVQGQGAAEEENADVPVYSQRQMMQLDQGKNAEMQKLREEVQLYAAQKDQEVAAAAAERDALRAQIAGQQGQEFERITHENHILKQGIRIQQQAVERARGEVEQRVEQERAAFAQAGVQAAEHIRQLEAQNYALRLQLEQMAPASLASDGMPRWGEGY